MDAEISEIPLGSYRFPEESPLPFLETVTDLALAEVERIQAAALALGWTEAHLRQNRGRFKFPSGPEYGLITFLKGGRRVVQVKAHAIRVRTPAGTELQFYRPDRVGNPAIKARIRGPGGARSA